MEADKVKLKDLEEAAVASNDDDYQSASAPAFMAVTNANEIKKHKRRHSVLD